MLRRHATGLAEALSVAGKAPLTTGDFSWNIVGNLLARAISMISSAWLVTIASGVWK